MSFGWSPSDIVNIAKLCYEIYSFCRTAPAELQGLSNRLDKMGRKLDRLSTILDKSKLGTCKQVPALEQHLLDAKEHLEPLLSAINRAASAPIRAKGLARLALNQGKLRRIEKILDKDEREIDEMKIDLILVCSLTNMRYGNDLQLDLLDPGPPPGPTNVTVNLIDEILPVPVVISTVPLSLKAVQSDARKALMMAMRLRSRPSSEAEALHISDVAPEGSSRNLQMTDDFITEVVSLAEETELYSKDADPTQNLEQLTAITEKATHFRLALHSSRPNSRTRTAHYQLPTSDGISPDLFGREFFRHFSSISDDTSMRMWAFDHSQSTRSGSSHTSATEHLTSPSSHPDAIPSNELPLQDHSRDNDQIFRMSMASIADAVVQLDNEPSKKDQINLRGRSKVSLTMDPKASLSCSFDFEVSEGSVLLKVIPTDGPHGTSDAVFASGALLTPSNPSSRSSQSMSHGRNTMLLRSFQHCFQSRYRPIPHFLHPDVEGPIEEPDAPYTISFTARQYISMETASDEPRWTTSLMYIFHEKQDRITLCQMIFGKTLLMSAGSNKIRCNGQEVSHMSAISLWFDDLSQTRSMTFFPNLTGKTTTPKDTELKIHGLWDPNKAPRNSNALAVIAESMPRDDEVLNMSARPDRQSSVQSRGTFLSKASSATSQKWRKCGKLRCTIEFTRSSDRASFLSHLNNDTTPIRDKPEIP